MSKINTEKKVMNRKSGETLRTLSAQMLQDVVGGDPTTGVVYASGGY